MWSGTAGAGWSFELEADGVRYRLPPRQLGWMRHFGWIPVAIGVAVGFGALSLALRLAWPVIERGLPAGDPSAALEEWLRIGAGAMVALIGLLIAHRMVRIGAIVVAGHSEIELRGGRLVGSEHGGPFRQSRRVAAAEVRALRVSEALGRAPSGAAPGAAGFGPLGALARLEAVLGSGRTIALATGYAGDDLEALARDLVERIPSTAALSGGALGPPPTVERVGVATPEREASAGEAGGWSFDERPAEASRSADAERAARPPEGCPIQVERTGGGFVVRVPPAGLVRGSHGLFVMGVIWTAMVLGIGAVIAAVALRGGGSGDLGPLGALAMLALFLAIGVGLLWFGARAGTRSTTLELSPPLLRVVTVALGRVREETLELGDLRAIRVGPSGIRVNGRDVFELQLHRKGGGHRGLLRERRNDELEWLAAFLRSETGPGEAAGASGSAS